MTDQQTSRPRLSVAMIVRDAEQLLRETLDSVREIADEIVVCDTQSADKTVEIAARLATRVVQCPWTDDFSAARNACLEHVTGDWVLWLDAGERLDPGTLRVYGQRHDALPAKPAAVVREKRAYARCLPASQCVDPLRHYGTGCDEFHQEQQSH